MIEWEGRALCRWLGAILTVLWFSAYADEAALGEQAFFDELPVVLTVTRLPQSRAELPSAVTVIDREMIEASGVVELTDLFRLVAGFQIGHYHDVDGPRVAVAYHGNTEQYSRRMQVLIDGRSVYTWGTGGAEWTDLPIAIDDIERIEVSRGPNGVTYGSNAFLGVINIITYHAGEQTGSYVRTTLDDDQFHEVVLRHAERSGDFSYRLSGRYQSDDGFDDYTSPRDVHFELNDDRQTSALTFRGDYRGGVNDYWTLQIGGSTGPREVGYTDKFFEPVHQRELTTHYQQLRWQHIADSDTEYNIQFYHNLHNVEDKFQTAPLPADLQLLLGTADQTLARDTSIESERYELEFSHRFRLTQDMRMVWGGAFREDVANAADYFDSSGQYQHQLSRLFFNGEWKPGDRWVVNLGDMLEQSNLTGDMHSPRVAINRLVGTAGYVRVGAGRAYRIPTALEAHANYTIRSSEGYLLHTLYASPDELPPERIDSMELAFGVERKDFEVEAKLFREEIRDEISTVEDQAMVLLPYWFMATVGETTVQGAELQLKVRTDRSLLSVAYANTQASGWRLRDINPEWVIDVGDAVPRQTFNTLFSYRLAEGVWGGVNYYYVSPMRFYSGDVTDSVRSLDVNFSKKFKLSGHEATWRLLFKNLHGDYFDFEKETISKRSVYLTLSMGI